MYHRFLTRVLSLLLLTALLVSELGTSLAYAAEVPAETASSAEAGEDATSPAGDETPTSGEDPASSDSESPAAEEPAPEASGSDGTADSDAQQTEEDPSAPSEDGSEDSVPPETGSEAEDTSLPEEAPGDTAGDGSNSDSAQPSGDDSNSDSERPSGEDAATDGTEDGAEASGETEEELTEAELAEQAQMEEVEQLLRAKLRQRSGANYSYATELAKFPSSYQSYLQELHEAHPDWIFVAVDTGLTWDEAINGETGTRSTVDYNLNGATSGLLMNNHSGYYSSSSYSGTNHYRPIDGTHVSSSRAMVAYYMDPRNFLIDQYIFQFEDQSYSSVQTVEGVRAILSGTDLATATTYINTSGKTVTLESMNSIYGSDYATIIYNAGLATGVSPYFLASKIIQETGGDTSYTAIRGNVSGYVGYYNFFNIGATASASGGAVYKGLTYAKNHNWSNPVLAIVGGAQFLGDSYINKGQNTAYYMRFNVSPDATYSTFSHQYMSATYAVASEAINTRNGYEDAGALENPFLFYIPVYDNIPSQTSTVSLTSTTRGTVSRSSKLYASPSTSGGSLATVSSGSSVTILGGSVTSATSYINRLYYPYWYQVQVTVSGKTYTGYIQEQNVTPSSVYTLRAGATQSLSSILSTSGSVGTIYYETSNPDVATVSDSGTITAVANGSCTIYAISGGGSFDAIGLTVSGSGLSTPTVSASAVSNGIQVRWSAVSGADSYRVYRRTASSSWVRIGSGPALSFTDATASSGTTYYYTVRAVQGSVLSGYDTTGASAFFLSMPVLQSASGASSGITVRWGQVSGAESYLVYRKTAGSDWVRIATVSSTSYTDSSVTEGTKYTYTVRASAASVLSSYNTTGVSATANSALATPTVSASTVSRGIQVRWSAVSGADSYRVYRRTASSGWVCIGSGPALSFTDATASSGTTYYYTVRAVKGSVLSGYDTTGAKVLFLSTPVLRSASNSSSGITVRWDQVSGANSYLVYRKTAGSGWVRIATVSSTSYTDSSGLTTGTKYTYTVRASAASSLSYYNTTGVSATAAEAFPLSTPSVSASTVSRGIQVRWSAVPGAESYRVYRKTANSGWVRIGSGPALSFTDTNVSSGTTYYYTVRAVQGSVLSGYDTTGAKIRFLSTPALQSASSASSGITVRWGQVSGAESYRIYRKTAGSGWVRIATVSSTSYTDSSVTAGTKYTYTVRAYAASGLSYYNTSGVSATFSASSELVSYVTTGNLYYRTGPGFSYDIAGVLSAGTVVQVVSGVSVSADDRVWYRAYINGSYYYLSSAYLEKA